MPTDNSGSFGNVTDAAASANNYPANNAIASTEQLYCPILIPKTGGGSGGLSSVSPSFIPPAGTTENGSFDGHIAPTSDFLNPYFAKIFGDDGTTMIQNNDFQMMVNDGTGVNGADLNIRKVDRSSISKVVVPHHRGPMIMAGWGFDVADRPAPCQSGSAFTFDPAIVNDRSKWQAGPVDLKWDVVRKVWSSGHHMVCGVAGGAISAPVSPCSPTTFTLKVFRNNVAEATPVQLTNCDLEETITVVNRDPSLTQEDVPGMVFVIAVRINYEYIPVWVGCPEPGGSAECVC